jgi:sigma-B regulation protein RsbU (phosphoserine phosphatase)
VKPAAEIRILVVEDDPFFQRVLTKRLEVEGYQVQTASDGREGMKAIVSFEPDLVLSDWMMPQVDGLELCQSVKTGLREAAPYFILLTARGEINDKLLGLETGADDYLVKPCDQGELMARVRAGLRIVLLTKDLRKSALERQDADGELARLREQLAARDIAPVICPDCRRVRVAPGKWVDLATWLASPAVPTPCPDCFHESDGLPGAATGTDGR